MAKFTAKIEIIGVNPFVFVPGKILEDLFKKTKKDRGPIRIKGTVNGKAYKQTLVKYSGDWRLYINTIMLKNSTKRIGEIIDITIEPDFDSREITAPVKFIKALDQNKKARKTFDKLPPFRRTEIIRYLAQLKTEKSLDQNIVRAIGFLSGNERFVGRDKP